MALLTDPTGSRGSAAQICGQGTLSRLNIDWTGLGSCSVVIQFFSMGGLPSEPVLPSSAADEDFPTPKDADRATVTPSGHSTPWKGKGGVTEAVRDSLVGRTQRVVMDVLPHEGQAPKPLRTTVAQAEQKRLRSLLVSAHIRSEDSDMDRCHATSSYMNTVRHASFRMTYMDSSLYWTA